MHRLLAAFLIGGALMLPGPAAAAPCAGFTDVQDSNSFCPNVTWMKSRGITLGCTATLYCPNDSVTRLAMAAFISRLDRVLPPTLVDAGGTAFGAIHSKNASGELLVAYRSAGRLHLLKFIAVVVNPTLGYIPIEGTSVYFVSNNCTGTAYVQFAQWLPNIDDITATGYSTIVEAVGGALSLYASVSSPLPANVLPSQIVVASRLQSGVCTAISAAPLQYALAMSFVEDLSAKFTGPFQWQ